MFHTHASAILPFAPEAVFAAVGGVEAALRWQVGVVGVCRTRARPDAAGAAGAARLRVSYFALGTRYSLAVRVTTYEPPSRFAYEARGATFALAVALEVVPVLGGTQVSYDLCLVIPSMRFDASAAPGAAADRDAAALRRLLSRRAPRDLARLGAHVARRLGTAP